VAVGGSRPRRPGDLATERAAGPPEVSRPRPVARRPVSQNVNAAADVGLVHDALQTSAVDWFEVRYQRDDDE
jgi:hypothetical protein